MWRGHSLLLVPGYIDMTQRRDSQQKQVEEEGVHELVDGWMDGWMEQRRE